MLEQILEGMAREFDRRAIPYMLIGGQAVLIYGEPRLTRDIGVTIGGGPDRLDTILQAAAACGWKVLAKSPEAFVRDTMVLPCLEQASGMRIDIMFSLTRYERQAIQRAPRVQIGKAEVRFASAEDVIIHKIFAGRPRDMDDVKGILLKQPALDRKYIDHWLKELDPGMDCPLARRFDEAVRSVGNRA